MSGPQPRKRRLQLQGLVDRFADELLDDGFAPGTERARTEATAEALDTGNADSLRLMRIAIQNDDPGVGENLPYFIALGRCEIVLAEDRDERHPCSRKLP